MKANHIIVLVTAPNRDAGELIAQTLLDKQLIACANFVTPITSLFSWQGKIEREDEVLLILKSRAELFESQIIPAIEALHPYEVPEIIALPILTGSVKYLDWIDEVTLQA